MAGLVPGMTADGMNDFACTYAQIVIRMISS
jgi:hypothetical protein